MIKGSFAAPDGMRGYAAEYQNNGIALYLTPDGKHVLVGSLFDEQGQDLSAEPLEKLVYAPMAKEVWAKMDASHWIADGDKNAPRVVYLFSDPNCPYCTMFWEQARPWVKAGKVHPVSDAVWNTAGGIIAGHLLLDDIEAIAVFKPKIDHGIGGCGFLGFRNALGNGAGKLHREAAAFHGARQSAQKGSVVIDKQKRTIRPEFGVQIFSHSFFPCPALSAQT